MEPIQIKEPNIPDPLNIPKVQLKVPTALIPQYAPMVVAPTDLERPDGVKAETTDEPQPRQLQIPVLDMPIPVPSTEVLVTAITTAVVAVATTTVAQTLFEPIQKQAKKQLQKQVDKWKKKRKEKKDSSES